MFDITVSYQKIKKLELGCVRKFKFNIFLELEWIVENLSLSLKLLKFYKSVSYCSFFLTCYTSFPSFYLLKVSSYSLRRSFFSESELLSSWFCVHEKSKRKAVKNVQRRGRALQKETVKACRRFRQSFILLEKIGCCPCNNWNSSRYRGW